MPYYGFKGGIHPSYNKSATQSKETEILPVAVGDVVHIPLAQHIGAPAKALVKKNQQVKAGEPIGEAAGFISTTIHSSVTGKVVAIGSVEHPVGGRVPGVSVQVEEVNDDFHKSGEDNGGPGGESPDTSKDISIDPDDFLLPGEEN